MKTVLMVLSRGLCFCFLVVCLLVCGCHSTFTPLPPKETRTYQSVLEWSRDNGMPGAILLVQTPQTNFLGAIGWADTKQKVPLQPAHEFRIGSLTKTFVSLVAAQMEVEGKLDADAVITNYLPAPLRTISPCGSCFATPAGFIILRRITGMPPNGGSLIVAGNGRQNGC